MLKEEFLKIQTSQSKTFLTFCFCFIFGVGISSAGLVQGNLLFFSFIAFWIILFFIIISWLKKARRFFLFCCLFFVLGSLRYFISIPNNTPEYLRYYNGQTMNIIGLVSEEPAVGQADVKYVVNVDTIASGKLFLKLPLYPRYNYGDRLELLCNLQSPKNFADSSFNYEQYLARQGIWSVCAFPVIARS